MSLKHGVTGGQYSLARVLFATYLFVHFVHLVPWTAELFSSAGVLADGRASPLLLLFPNVLALADGPIFVTVFVLFGALLCIPFALGYRDRWAALLLYYVWACLFGRNPLISNPGLPYVGWLLLMHAFVAPAPYGSWTARGRADPAGEWRLPRSMFAAAWWVMAAGYSFSGYTKLISPSWIDGTAILRVLENPLARQWFVVDAMTAQPEFVLQGVTYFVLALELLYLPLALFRRVRPWLWFVMVGMHLSLLFVIDFADLTFGVLMIHLFTFDPGWVRALAAERTERIFYDGMCGLCHGAVRFVLAEDRTGDTFRFAPLQSAAFRDSYQDRTDLPDSVIVERADGELLIRSDAVLHIGRRLGGWWRVLATVGALVPRPLRDVLYDGVARVRLRLFKKPEAACPIVPPTLRARFEV